MLPEGQSGQIKKQLLEQINSTFPEDKKADAISKIEVMDDEQLEEFLKQNNLIKGEGAGEEQKCVFCSIVFGDIPSTKIGENEKALAILEINPISKSHAIVIPKEHVSKENIPQEAFDLANEISEKIKNKFGPKNVIIETSNLFGHEIINVLPIYGNETLSSPKKQATPEELLELQKKLGEAVVEVVEEKPTEEINEKNTWLPKRIP